MPNGLLDEVRRCAVIQGVADVGMSQPMRRDRLGQPSACCGLFHDPMHLHRIEMAAAFAGSENRLVGIGTTKDS